jgi:hypothetical protein
MSIRSINNFSLQTFRDYFAVSGKDAEGEPPGAAMQATGGNVISEFTEGSTIYRAHIFTGSGELTIVEGSELGQYLIVGGGGAGGGGYYSGGGGAGGYVTNDPADPRYNSQPLTLSPGPYSIVVGAGGAPSGGPAVHKNPGNPSVAFGHTAYGGGSGAGPGFAGDPGGCGGGGVYSTPAGGAGSKITNTSTDAPPQGWPGGGGSPGGGAGGGGSYLSGISTAGIGITASTPHSTIGNGSRGGQGQPSSFSGIATHYAAGGSGGLVSGPSVNTFSDRASGIGGRGALNHSPVAGAPQTEMAGIINTGSGGGGTDKRATGYEGSGSGASGVVIVRYPIGSVQTEKATGGNVSYTSTHTIHAFMQSGTFTTPSTFSETVEYVVIGGGGAGGCTQGGGGGAGGYLTGSTPITGSQDCSITIGIGGIADLLLEDTTIDAMARGSGTSFLAPAGTITARGGGGGAQYGGSGQDSGPSSGSGGGNSGGAGTAGTGNGSPFPGTIGASPANGWGHSGGSSNSNQGGGGGGAGGTGGNSPTTAGGSGGAGIQVPTTFRHPSVSLGTGPTSPTVSGGDTTGRYWVAGGGGGSSIDDGGAGGYGGGGGTATIGYAGGGNGNNVSGTTPTPTPYNGTPGVDGTGGGGGAGSRSGTSNPGPSRGGSGGSGIILLAYPT